MSPDDLARYEATARRQIAREVATTVAITPGHLLQLINHYRATHDHRPVDTADEAGA